MKKYTSILTISITLVMLQMLLTACPGKKKCPPNQVAFECEIHEMLSDSSGQQLYSIVTDTTIYITREGSELTIFGATISLDEEGYYFPGYHPICDNNTFYAHVFNECGSLEAAYNIPMGDSTLYTTYIGTAQ